MLTSARGLPVGPGDVLVTRGSQMALTLAARAMLRPGDALAVDCIDIDPLKRLVSRTTLRAVYVTPHHQYPTTVTLKAARRLSLLARARAGRIEIIEDDYDHDGRPVLPLASADHARLVVCIGTLSKVLAPGLGIGYIVAPPAVLGSASAIHSLLDIQGDQATEAAVAALIEDCELQRHVARVRRVHANRREILASSLKRVFGDGAEFILAPGGMALWVHLPMSVDIDERARRSVEHGVSWHRPAVRIRWPFQAIFAI
jgi:GntR family transcriptional regulator / MocR family aminotransferase